MGCINRNHKDFKYLAEKNNVSINTLELITHKYWIETGSEDSFPTNAYIQAQIGNTNYYESSKAVREVWENNYKTPQTFNTIEEANQAKTEALRFFPPEAVLCYRDFNDKYVFIVRHPVERLNYNNIFTSDVIVRDKQDQQDYDIIADNLIAELNKNRNFAIANIIANQKNNKVLSLEVSNAIRTGRWNSETIAEFNNILNEIKDGRIQFQRTVGERRPFTESISEIHAGASIIAGGRYGTSKEKSRNPQEEFRAEAKQGKEQEKRVEAWAKANDLWLNDYTDEEGNKANTLEDLLNSQWPFFDQGSEAVVHRYDDNTLLKAINMSHTNDNLAKLLDKIALFNREFPETALNVVGFGRDSLGHFRVITLQNRIKGQELTDDEVKEFFDKYEQKAEEKKTNNDVIISDLGEYNILKDKDGIFHVIDADVVYNTPALGGDVTFENSLIRVSGAKPSNNLQFSIEAASDEKTEIEEQYITVAPYFRQKLTSKNKTNLQRYTTKVMERAQKLANEVGLQIEVVEVVGGTFKGSSEITYQYRINSTDQEKVDLFASLMGDLSFEYQDAVIAANYTNDKSQITAYEITWKAPSGTSIENVEALLSKLGINGSTYHYNNEELTITTFSEEETKTVINKLKDTKYEYKEHQGQNSRYLENLDRRNAYRSWLNTNRGTQNRKLYNAVRKALVICEAAAKYPDIDVEISKSGYRKGDPQKNSNTAYVFTENAQAASAFYGDALGYATQVDADNSKIRLTVSDAGGTNQAGIRMDAKDNKSNNAFGLVVKKIQQDANGGFLVKEGQFEDTAENFKIFKKFNERFFDKLDSSGLTKIIFPSQIALGKAALPKRFAEWLQKELKDKYGVNTTLSKNTRSDYDGYGLSVNSINTKDAKRQRNQEAKRLKAARDAERRWRTTSFNTEILGDQVQVNSLEQAFALNKLQEMYDEMDEVQFNDWNQKILDASPSEVIELGKTIPMSPSAMVRWNNNKRDVWNKLKEEYAQQNSIDSTPTVMGSLVEQTLEQLGEAAPKVKYEDEMGEVLKERGYRNIQQTIENLDNSNNNNNFAKTNDSNNEQANLRQRDRQILSQRFSPEELQALSGILAEAEALLQRGDESSVPEKQKEITGSQELATKQEAVLENWAKKKGIWIDNTAITLTQQYDEPFASEGEANVYRKDEKTVVKEITMAYYIEPHLMLDRIVLHNSIAPSTSLSLSNFGRNENGDFVVIVEQPFVEGERPSQEEIVDFMRKMGFEPYNKRQTEFKNNETDVLIMDLHDENVIKAKNGAFFIIDADFRINTANYNLGGKRLTKAPSKKSLQKFATPQGEVYGFYDQETNTIYLDRKVISPEHPIHEYTHLWDNIVAQKNPDLWNKGVKLMEKLNLWEEIATDPNYGLKWEQEVENGELSKEKMKFYIASEVHARLAGKEGKRLLEERAKEEGEKGIYNKLRKWILDVWKDLAATFSKISKEKLNNMTLDEFNRMTLRDFINAENLQEAPSVAQENKINQNESRLSDTMTDNNSQETGTMVSLPSYEYFNDLYEDTLVDAEWKIPLLKDLDDKINLDNTPEENENIISQMNRILHADSEDSYVGNALARRNDEDVQRNLSEYEKLTEQINNLLDSDIITASEIRHVAELVVNSISDSITKLQTEEGLAEQQFETLKTDLDFSKASRKEIVEAAGLDRLIGRAKLLFDPENADYEDIDTILQADLITNNWDAIMMLASDIFAMNEGFGIMKNYNNGSFITAEGVNVDYDNFNQSQDESTIKEEEGDEQEHWQVESRTIDVLNSMSALVRQAIHQCYQLDKNGNIVYSKWGIAERVNPRNAVNSILRWTQGSLSLEDMINKLSSKKEKNPWLIQLINRLSDNSGKDTDFQSQFYGVFSKHFQLYSIVLLEDNKYHSIMVNSHPALTEAMQAITTQYKMEMHPLFKNGINSKLLSSKTEFSLHTALASLQDIANRISKEESLNAEDAKKASVNIMGVCRILGYPVSEEMVDNALDKESVIKMSRSLQYIVKKLDDEASKNRKNYNPFAFDESNGIGGDLRNFLTPITDTLEDTAINAFYDSGKMYQSYITPSFMTKLMNKFKLEGKEFENFIMQEYGNTQWFKLPNKKGLNEFRGGWRNDVLDLLVANEEIKKAFDHKVELNFNSHNYMRNMSDAEYTLSLLTEYFDADWQNNKTIIPTWFRIPMLSNKPSSEFLKLPSYRGPFYKESIIGTSVRDSVGSGLYGIFLQELSRIQTVLMRNKGKKDPGFIKNFDTNGKKFNFLPFLNPYLDNSNDSKNGRNLLRNDDNSMSDDNDVLAELIQKKIEGLQKLTADEEIALFDLTKKALRSYMENRVASIMDTWEREGIIEAAKSVKGIGEDENTIKSNIENFLWNDSYMSKIILQLTVGDIAYYKDAEDLQKRLAQLHAPGIRGNINARDYGDPEHGIPGKRVSDGKYRTAILRDWEDFRSNIIANITEVFNRKIDLAPETQKEALRALRDDLVRPRTYNEDGTVKDEGGKYWNINVADAQGFSSPSSRRKKDFIFGRWSHQAEDIYQKLIKGDYNFTDLETAFQPEKPFVYTHLQKSTGVKNAPIKTINVPFQAKNAEYLLIMADAILKGEKLSRPNLLRAVYRVMEESERLNPTKGIDTIQFESAIKSGLQGTMDIHQFAEMEGGEEAAFIFMMNQIYKEENDSEGNRIYRNYNTDEFIHEASYEDYCLQQEVPEHFKEHTQAHGSQIRMIIPSDLDLYKNPNGDLSAEDNKVYYEWKDPDGTLRKEPADKFRKEYEDTIADNISESIDNLIKELHIDSEDKKERNIALSKILQREILSSPRYGVDLIQACSIDKETGEFRIPKGDPIQAKRIEQLINSIIKNRVNKQEIAGGPIVQVSNFGTSKKLHIRFNDKKGNLIPLEEEYDASKHEGTSYKEYLKKNQGGIAYFEVYAPIWSNELFEKFANTDGTINVEAIEATDPELLKMVSYRIPTEDKYSCAPMKVVGFMPREAGAAIMLPYELTTIDDSDFDVDKRYVMRKDIPIKKHRTSEIKPKLLESVLKSFEKFKENSPEKYKELKQKTNKSVKELVKDQVNMFLDNPEKMRHADDLMESIYREYQKIAYYTQPPTSGKKYRDNKIIDMTYAVLTNEMTADKILNPGGFDAPKKVGYMVSAYKNTGISWEKLQKMSISQLKDLSYTNKDLTWADTQVQFYRQNSAAASLIGVFAVNKVAHATLESNDITIAVDELCGDNPFTIADTTFGGHMTVDGKYDSEGNLIGKTLGSLVSASADAVKDPILNLMNINMTTAGMLNTMLRLGMPFENAALFLSQNIIERALKEFNKENLTGYETLGNIINKWLMQYREKHGIKEGGVLDSEEITKEELIEGLTSYKHSTIDYKVLLAFQKLKKLTDAMRNITFATRLNSISSAVGPLIIDNLILEHKIEQFLDENTEDGTHFYTHEGYNVDFTDVMADHPILNQFSRAIDIAKIMFSDMPAGSTGFRNLLHKLPKDLSNKIYGDKKLLDQLCNFYQSYLLIQSGVINPKHLKRYVDNFPKYFSEQKFKERYKNNALIQAIKTTVSKSTGRPFLSIKITGMDQQAKEELSNGWIDLHKDNPELSQQLFTYCFFRAGVGFNPKTFMSLVPTYVKERIVTTLENGDKASYVDTYRHFPETNYSIVIDQFIRNNWGNSKLVPKKGGKDAKYKIDYKRGRLLVTDKKDIADLNDATYIKTTQNRQTYLWRLIGGSKTNDSVEYMLITPLGENGEYLEMSTSNIKNPLSNTVIQIEDNITSDIKGTSPIEDSASEIVEMPVANPTEEIKDAAAMADLLMKKVPTLSKEDAVKKYEQIKNNPTLFAGFLQNVFKQKGLTLNKKEAIEEFKKYCS